MAGKTPFIRMIEDVFDGFRAQNDRYMLGFLNRSATHATYYGVGPAEDPWTVHDDCRSMQGQDASWLFLALDLRKEFNRQMPASFHAVTSWTSFVARPQIHIEPRPGGFAMPRRGVHLTLVHSI